MTLLPNAVPAAPSVLTLPSGGNANPQADDAIDIAELCGLELLGWQQDVLRASMRRADTGRWLSSEIGLVVPRQNGKGSVLEARQVAGLFVIGERLQLHSAHEFKTCYEHFLRVRNLIESSPLLMGQVERFRTGAGDQAIELKNGCRIRFIARSRTSGRGFSADCVYLDEAFELSDATLGAILPSLSARPDPQIWYSSSAPHKESAVLHRVRARGVAGDDPRLMYAEWSADSEADPADPVSWAAANPSLGVLIDPDRIDTARRSLGPDDFAREHLGIPEKLAETTSIIPADQWEAMTVPTSSPIVSGQSFALDVSPTDRAWSSFAVAGRTVDGAIQLEVFDRRPGTSWVVERAVKLFADHGRPLRVEKGGPAGSLVPLLEQAGVVVDQVSTADLARATGQFIDAALGGNLRHLGDPYLRTAVASAVLRHTGDADLWSRRSSRVDITPLVACTLAFSTLEPDAPADEGFYVY